jgi:hypothetical protein
MMFRKDIFSIEMFPFMNIITHEVMTDYVTTITREFELDSNLC